jgi:hypothetical protein
MNGAATIDKMTQQFFPLFIYAIILSLLDLSLFFPFLEVSSITPSFPLLCTSISLSFWVPKYFLLSYAINHANQFLFPWKRMNKENNSRDCLQLLKKKNEERKQQPWMKRVGRVGTRGRVKMGWLRKNCGFRQKYFKMNLRHPALSSSKAGGPGLIGGDLVRCGYT